MTKNTDNRPVPARTALVLFQEETSSTNTELKSRASSLPGGTVLWSLRQTAGRGRSGRSFLSPEGGLYYSMLLKFPAPEERLTAVTPLAAVAVARALKAVCGLDTQIKWPNDILCSGRKLCGILTESTVGPAGMQIIVGIGVNVNTPSFPGLPEGLACSVFTETGRRCDIAALAARLTAELDRAFAPLPAELDRAFAPLPETAPEYLAEYRRLCCTLGRQVAGRGKALRIEDDFSLVTQLPDGTENRVFFGEIFQE